MEQQREGQQKADLLVANMKNVYKEDELLYKNGGLANKKILFCKELEKELRNVTCNMILGFCVRGLPGHGRNGNLRALAGQG